MRYFKYSPNFPDRFASFDDALAFLREFFPWYNDQHRHSGLAFFTPSAVHHGQVEQLAAIRNDALARAYALHPERFVHGWEHCDLERREISVVAQHWRGHVGTPKSGKARKVPMTQALIGALSALPRTSDYVITAAKANGPASHGSIRSVVTWAAKHASVPDQGPHGCRHSYATGLLLADVRVVREDVVASSSIACSPADRLTALCRVGPVVPAQGDPSNASITSGNRRPQAHSSCSPSGSSTHESSCP